MTVRAKFKCRHVEQTGDVSRIILDPVISGSAENKSFYKYTPGGQIDLQVVNPAAAEQFTPGTEFYVDFTPTK